MSGDASSPFLRAGLTTAAVVIGAGVVIGVSGLYVFFNRQQQRQLAHLTRTIEGLRKDVGELKLVATTTTTTTATTCNDRNYANKKSAGCATAVITADGGQHPHRTPVGGGGGGISSNHKGNCTSGATSRAASIGTAAGSDENGGELYYDVSDDENYNSDFGPITIGHGEVERPDDETDESPPSRSNATAATSSSSSSSSCSPPVDFAEIDSLLGGDAVDNELAYSKLVSNKTQGMTNPEFVWRLVRACYLCFLTAGRLGDQKRQKDLIADGMDYSVAGLAIDNEHPDLHKWYAVLLGRSTEFMGVQDKIKNGFKFKEHLDHAIRLRPDDRTLYFMKGRWCYEVSMLTWIERKVAATLFATPPTSTLDEARQQFLKVEELYPLQWKENLLYVAKCLIGEGNYSDGAAWLKKASKLECQTPDEEIVHGEVQQLLSKYRKYAV